MTEKDPNTQDENLGSFYMGRMRSPPEPERMLPKGLLTVVTVLAFGGILWYAYPQGAEKYTDVDVPVVKADTEPYKSRPEDPGGMEVRHQDSTIFEPLEGKPGEKKVEKMLPLEEEPLDKQKVLEAEKPQLKLEPQLKETEAMKAGTEAAAATESSTPAPEVKEEPAVAEKVEEKPATPPPAAKAGEVYIQLGSYRDPAGAKKAWSGLQASHGSLLDGVSMRTVSVNLGEKGVFHRLQAGPLAEARAGDVCAVLKTANDGGCFIAR